MEESNDKQTNRVEVYPLSKGKRMLVFLADLFLTFILSLGFFHLMVFPISRAAYGFEEKYASLTTHSDERDATLYGNKVLFYEEEKSSMKAEQMEVNLSYTYKQFVRYFSVKDVGKEYDVLHTFAVSIRHDTDLYQSYFTKYGQDYFNFAEGKASLKDQFVQEFKPYFEPGNTPSAKAEEHYEDMLNSFFLRSYSNVVQDCQKNDLVYQGISYKQHQDAMQSISRGLDIFISLNVFGSYLLASALLFILLPLLSKNKKTLAMMMIRRERVNYVNLKLLTNANVLLWVIYELVGNFFLSFFIAFPVLGFNELFALPVVFPICLISLLYVLAGFIFLLCDPYNRTLSDFLSRSIMIDEETLDVIYRSKGYHV